MNPVLLNNLSLKYQRFTPSGCIVIWIEKFDFVAKTQFLLEFPNLLTLTAGLGLKMMEQKCRCRHLIPLFFWDTLVVYSIKHEIKVI